MKSRWGRIVLAGTTILVTAASALAQDVRSISISTSSGSLPGGGTIIAKELGLYEQCAVDVSIVPMDSASVAVMALISGSVELSAGAPVDVVLSGSKGQPLVAIESVYRGFAGNLVLSKGAIDRLGLPADAPVEDRIKALDGLTIATPSASSTFSLTLVPTVKDAEVNVNVVYMSQASYRAALETGAIDGFVSSAPFYVAPVREGLGDIWLNGPKGDFPAEFLPVHAATVQTTPAFAEANPELIQCLKKVYADFSTAVAERPDDVKAAIGRAFPNLDADTIDFLYGIENFGNRGIPLSSEDMAGEIAYLIGGGVDVPADTDPSTLLVE